MYASIQRRVIRQCWLGRAVRGGTAGGRGLTNDALKQRVLPTLRCRAAPLPTPHACDLVTDSSMVAFR